jgi:hypothetical protein
MDRAVRKPSIFGNKRRNSSATAARLRSTDWAVGWVISGLIPEGKDHRTKQEQCQDGFSTEGRISQPALAYQ